MSILYDDLTVGLDDKFVVLKLGDATHILCIGVTHGLRLQMIVPYSTSTKRDLPYFTDLKFINTIIDYIRKQTIMYSIIFFACDLDVHERSSIHE